MKSSRVKDRHRIEVRDFRGQASTVDLDIQVEKIFVHPPIVKKNRYPTLALTIIYAKERGVSPKGRRKIEWKLITNLPVRSQKDAIEKIAWYALRWKIEVFHKILKSGCRAEDSKLRTAERLANLIAVFCVLSWRVFWMTMLKRRLPRETPDIAFTKQEMKILDRLVPNQLKTDEHNLAAYLR